jgi:protein-L-isoaspartate(D-aspartate) O-methyltransferase
MGWRHWYTRRVENPVLADPILKLPRRAVLAGAMALPAGMARAAVNVATSWTRTAFEEAMAKSGRPVSLTDAQFAAIQARRGPVLTHIASYLKERLGNADPAVMEAFAAVPREYYHYQYSERRAVPEYW